MQYFLNLLDRAISWLNEQESEVDEALKEAINCRLTFRRDFLLGLAQDINILETRSTHHFASCLSNLDPLAKTIPLGKPVPEAFSWKIQRKLASTVPPRPMVKTNSDDALAHLKRLCQDAIDLLGLLDYRGPYNFKVWIATRRFEGRLSGILLTVLGGRLDASSPKASTVCIYPMSSTNDHREQNHRPRCGFGEAVPL